MDIRQQLKNAEERAARQVNSVHGYLTAADVAYLATLRRLLGARWDAINGRWEPLEDEE